MDVFARGVFLLTLSFLVGLIFCGVDRRTSRTGIKIAEEFQISPDDRTDGADFLEYQSSEDGKDNSVAEDEEISNRTRVFKTLSVKNGGPWGDWGPAQFCPDGSYAVGYDMKIEPRKCQKCFDNTALNAIKLICEFPDGNVSGEVTSTQGHWGSWVGQVKCQSRVRERQYLTTFDLQVQKYRGSLRDDTAANYVKFRCLNICGRGKPTELVKPPGHGIWGTWGAWSEQCPTETAICGIKTKVEKPQGSIRDDTALNDVKFYCCI